MIHQFQLNGYNVVLDVCSGSIHVVDPVSYEMIRRYETQDRDTLLADMARDYAGHDDVSEEDLLSCYD